MDRRRQEWQIPPSEITFPRDSVANSDRTKWRSFLGYLKQIVQTDVRELGADDLVLDNRVEVDQTQRNSRTEGNTMLVLSRKAKQKIVIGEDIELVVVAISGNRVKLGFNSPNDILILREEIQRRSRSATHVALSEYEVMPD